MVDLTRSETESVRPSFFGREFLITGDGSAHLSGVEAWSPSRTIKEGPLTQ